MNQDRMTGKTSRVVLAAAYALSEGKRVIIISHNTNMGTTTIKLIQQCLESIGLANCITFVGRDKLKFLDAGMVQTVSPETLCRIRGTTYDALLVDTDLTMEQLLSDSMSALPVSLRSLDADAEPSTYQNVTRTLSSRGTSRPQ